MSKTIELSPMELYPDHFEIVEDFDDKEITVRLLCPVTLDFAGTRPQETLPVGLLLRGYADVAADGTLNIQDSRYYSVTLGQGEYEQVLQDEIDALCEMEHKRRERERQVAAGQLELL